MNTAASWPTNHYGTSWRTIIMWFAWSDEDIIWDAIETIDPLMITARLRPTVVVGFEGDGWLQMRELAEIVQSGRATCIVVDGRHHLDATIAQISADCGDDAWVHVVGIARLDVADVSTYRALLAALEDRWEWFDLEMPYIEV